MNMSKPGLRIYIAASFLAIGCAGAYADSVAAGNKEGNRLFQQGKFLESEKAYLDAQLEAPGKPELLYNLGNALAKQKKYEPAIQSLRQATGKADHGLQASSWYNLGNALYESGNLPDAAQAFVQSLRANPSDRDAKRNLELALRRLKEQKQGAAGKDSKNDQQKKEEGKQDSPTQNGGQQDKKDEQKPGSRGRQDKDQQQQPQNSATERGEGTISKERALQILDAMKNQELAEQRKLMERKARRKTAGKDW
jgi:Ca-activated chloride channel family protein